MKGKKNYSSVDQCWKTYTCLRGRKKKKKKLARTDVLEVDHLIDVRVGVKRQEVRSEEEPADRAKRSAAEHEAWV